MSRGNPWEVSPPSARVLRLALVSSLVLPFGMLVVVVLSLIHGSWVNLGVGVVLLAGSVWLRSRQWPIWRRQLREARGRGD